MGRHAHKGLTRLASIALRSYHPKFVNDVAADIQKSAAALGIKASGSTPGPTQRTRWTVLRSPFVHKKAMDQFQMLTHKRLIELYGATPAGKDGSAVVHFLRYLEHTIMPLHPATRLRVILFSDEKLLPQDVPGGGGALESGQPDSGGAT